MNAFDVLVAEINKYHDKYSQNKNKQQLQTTSSRVKKDLLLTTNKTKKA